MNLSPFKIGDGAILSNRVKLIPSDSKIKSYIGKMFEIVSDEVPVELKHKDMTYKIIGHECISVDDGKRMYINHQVLDKIPPPDAEHVGSWDVIEKFGWNPMRANV